MPFYATKCVSGHEKDVYSSHRDFGANDATVGLICEDCGHTMTRVFVPSGHCSVSTFSEKRPQWIHNMGHDPVLIRSMREFDQKSKEHQVETIGLGKGNPGQWV